MNHDLGSLLIVGVVSVPFFEISGESFDGAQGVPDFVGNSRCQSSEGGEAPTGFQFPFPNLSTRSAWSDAFLSEKKETTCKSMRRRIAASPG
jgi:hypothetical protein